MILFLLLMILFILVAALFAFLPLIKQRKFFTSIVCIIWLAVVSTGLYSEWGAFTETKIWINTGKQHYELQKKFHSLGSLDDIIGHMKQNVEKNPYDPNAWYLLGKLAINNNDLALAKVALARAHQLDKSNANINAVLEQLNKL